MTDGNSPHLQVPLGKWTPNMNTEEWTTLANTTLGRTEAYIRNPGGGTSFHSKVLTRVQGTVDTVPRGTVLSELGKIVKNGIQRVTTSKLDLVHHNVTANDDNIL